MITKLPNWRFAALLLSSDSGPLRQQVLKASIWSLAGYGISMAIRLGTSLIMSRLLAPEIFGVMAIATIVMIGLALFSDLGLRQNIIQSPRGAEPIFLDTAWSIQIVRGVVLWLFAVAVGLALSFGGQLGIVPQNSVYANPLLPCVVMVVGVGAAVGGFTSTKWAEANRNLSLGRITRIELSSQFAGFLFTLLWTCFDKSIWALVSGGLASTGVRVALSHRWLPGHSNRLRFDKQSFLEIFGFGRWLFLSSIVGFLVANGDRLILGGLLNSVDFGVCVIAFLIYGAVEQLLVRVVNDVSFPALSRIVRDQRSELRQKYYKLHFALASLTYLVAGGLVLSAEHLIRMLYDSRYWQAGWMLSVLSFGLFSIPSQIAVQCSLALGKPKIQLKVILTRLLTLTIVPIGFLLLGISGALWALIASQVLTVAATFAYTATFGFLSWRNECRPVPFFFVGAAAGIALNFAIDYSVNLTR